MYLKTRNEKNVTARRLSFICRRLPCHRTEKDSCCSLQRTPEDSNTGFSRISYPAYKNIALQIWDNAELGYKEVKSSALLQETLKKEGFTVEAGVADIPTAFVATYGSGQPVIGILAEFDALPGLAQQAVPEKKESMGKPEDMVADTTCLAQHRLRQVFPSNNSLKRKNLQAPSRYMAALQKKVGQEKYTW